MPALIDALRKVLLNTGMAAALAALPALLPDALRAQPAPPHSGAALPDEPVPSTDSAAGPDPPPLVLEFDPWLGFRAVSLGVNRGDLTGDYAEARPDLFLNLSIGRGSHGKPAGFFLAARLVPMNLSRQESFLAGEETADYGTSIRGFFLYAIPSYALRLQPNMELFGGVGLGWVRVSGNIALCCTSSESSDIRLRKVSLNLNRVVFPAFHFGWRLGYFLAFASMMYFDDGANAVSALDTGLFAVFSMSIPLDR
jgi:hypothetical protein